MARDKYKCRVTGCGSRNGLSCHHIIFRSEQGSDISSNLVLICNTCHDKVHGLYRFAFIEILAKSGNPDDVPNADEGLTFKFHTEVKRRTTWK